jgi:hypothetical protein
VHNALVCIMVVDAAQMPAAEQLQMTLSMRHGGLGLFKLTPEAAANDSVDAPRQAGLVQAHT